MPFVEVDFSDLEFHETLGRGSAGSVYRGVWKSKEKVVALKKLNLLESEAEVLSSLSHRNIVQFFGAVTVAPNFCIVIEYAERGSLYEFLKETAIDFQQILQWAKQIALGMNYLHYEAPVAVIHRDLKSKNVVITADLTAKLCDFGSSRFHPHTTKLSLVGTFPWMAPEVIQQQPVTAACDVFSYSVVLWELLTLEVPYKGLEGLQVAWLVVAKEQRLTIPSSCPPVFADLMKKCWAQDPMERLTFKEVLAVLDKILEKGSIQEETDHFLSQKSEWKLEIEQKLEELKKVESALSCRERELKKKEQQLKAREKHLESISSRTAENTAGGRESHDVEQWTEQEVIDWLFSLQGGQLTEHAILFQNHHITGHYLFMLTADDLLEMGVLSLGHRKQLMEEVEILRQDYHRLKHFPPLQHPPKVESTPVALQPVTENLTIIYCSLCRKGLTPEETRWKYYVDFDGAWSGLVQTVQFVISSSIPSDIVTLSQAPHITPGWVQGSSQLECIIHYKDIVVRPRETSYQFEPLETSCSTEELCVQLSLDPRKAHLRHLSTPSPGGGAAAMSLSSSQSSPQLSGIWADRSHVIRPRPPAMPRDSLRRPLAPTTPPRDLRRSFHSPSPDQDSSSTDGGLEMREPPQPQRGGVTPLKGAWSKPGSGAAVVRSSGAGPPFAKAQGGTNRGVSPPIEALRHLKHSVSGPVARRGGVINRSRRHTSESSYDQMSSYDQQQKSQQNRQWPRDQQQKSHDQQQRSHDQQQRSRDQQQRSHGHQRSWRRVGSTRQYSQVNPIREQEGEGSGYQRSYSTTQAHQNQSDRKSQASRKPYSEPT